MDAECHVAGGRKGTLPCSIFFENFMSFQLIIYDRTLKNVLKNDKIRFKGRWPIKVTKG